MSEETDRREPVYHADILVELVDVGEVPVPAKQRIKAIARLEDRASNVERRDEQLLRGTEAERCSHSKTAEWRGREGNTDLLKTRAPFVRHDRHAGIDAEC